MKLPRVAFVVAVTMAIAILYRPVKAEQANNLTPTCPPGTVLVGTTNSIPPQPICSPEPIPNSARALAEKAFNRMINNNARSNIMADTQLKVKSYSPNAYYGQPRQAPYKSRDENKIVIGYPKLTGMSVGTIYGAMLKKFDFSFNSQTAAVNGVKCVVINFWPKYGLTIETTSDNFVNKVQGQIYIRDGSTDLVRVVGSIPERPKGSGPNGLSVPFSFTYYALGFIPFGINVYKLEFSVEYALFNGVIIEKSLSGTADYSYLFGRNVEEYSYSFSNFKVRK